MTKRTLPPEPGPTRSALVAGATGLIGGYLLERLLEGGTYREVRALVRRPLERQHPKLTTVLVDFERLDEHAESFEVDDVFCCLGTTIKTAGSQAAFNRVDHDYVTEVARLGRAAGASRFLLVSSIGADASTRSFYLSVKGAAEESVGSFGYPELHVFRPSLLTGPRQENRPGERLAMSLMPLAAPLLIGKLRRYRPVHARTVAWAMTGAARTGATGRHVYIFDDIIRLAALPLP